ncbi:hypothetical protein J6590_023724 [Homalodisca vitripennis]|nr:hypothetical protein J6590_023724 [Homalodisca vitripennis]
MVKGGFVNDPVAAHSKASELRSESEIPQNCSIRQRLLLVPVCLPFGKIQGSLCLRMIKPIRLPFSASLITIIRTLPDDIVPAPTPFPDADPNTLSSPPNYVTLNLSDESELDMSGDSGVGCDINFDDMLSDVIGEAGMDRRG